MASMEAGSSRPRSSKGRTSISGTEAIVDPFHEHLRSTAKSVSPSSPKREFTTDPSASGKPVSSGKPRSKGHKPIAPAPVPEPDPAPPAASDPNPEIGEDSFMAPEEEDAVLAAGPPVPVPSAGKVKPKQKKKVHPPPVEPQTISLEDARREAEEIRRLQAEGVEPPGEVKLEYQVRHPGQGKKRKAEAAPTTEEGEGGLAEQDATTQNAAPVVAPPVVKKSHKKQSHKKAENLLAYTTGFVPGLQNIKNPAGEYVQRENNVDVVRQLSQARARAEKAAVDEAARQAAETGEEIPEPPPPASQILIIHPGSRHLRIGRASDFYPKEVPNCIARRADAPNRGTDPPVPGSRAKRISAEALAARESKAAKGDGEGDGDDVEMNGDGEEEEWVDPVDTKIGYLRDYLRGKLRANRLSTDYREGARVNAYNGRVKPEPIPEHNDPYRIDWTEVQDKSYFIGEEALRLAPSSGFKVRYPILHRSFNLRDWATPQTLLDDIALIIEDSLRDELNILPAQYSSFSVMLIVPDHGDRTYVQEMTHLLLSVMGFKEIAVHQEAYTAIFSAAMSSACVVDIGAQSTSVTFVDEGTVNADTRIMLKYGGDDITSALVALLQRSSFPYKDLDLARTQDWILMDKLKIKICTLEEHLVASTAWDFYTLKEQGLTDKYMMRTYDENILAPLCFFDTRLIDFEEKNGAGYNAFWNESEDIDDLLTTTYDDATGAMTACAAHLLPQAPAPAIVVEAPPAGEEGAEDAETTVPPSANVHANGISAPASGAATPNVSPAPAENDSTPKAETNGDLQNGTTTEPPSRAVTPKPEPEAEAAVDGEELPTLAPYEIIDEAARSPLDGAIAAAISMAGNESKIKVAANSILLIGGSSALKGMNAFLQERLPPLLRAKGIAVDHVSIVPPPRKLNPRFVSWKGAAVMCNLESLSDMWIRRDEWEAIRARALKDRYLFF